MERTMDSCPKTDAECAKYGFRWSWEDVSKKSMVVGKGPIAVPTDLEKLVAYFGAQWVLGILDGQSLRVITQRCRNELYAKHNTSRDELMENNWKRMHGIRNNHIADPTCLSDELLVEEMKRRGLI